MILKCCVYDFERLFNDFEMNLNDLSMGMTNDYIEALNYEATFIRIGSKIFGERG